MSKKVTLVLVSYNDRPYMEDFFRCAFAQDYPDWDIVLVDNASGDDSVAFAAQQPKTHVIALQENVGFGEGCNIGTRYALEQGADAVLLLNIDTTFEANLLTELVRLSEGRFVTTAVTYCNAPEGGRQLWYAGGTIDWESGNTNQLLYTQQELDRIGPAFPVDFVSGCCMLLPRSVVEQVGLFDTAYFLYYEDTDLCVRLQDAGVEMRCATTTSVWHKVGGSSVGGNEMSCTTQYYTARNRLLFAERHAARFAKGNLDVLRTILTERAYFDGPQNKKQELYILAAFQDYFKQHFVRGCYGRRLIEDHYFVSTGFYEQEADDQSFWYWASAPHAKIYLANARKQTVLYQVSFDTLVPEESAAASLTVEADGKLVGRYDFPAQPRFAVAVAPESVCCLDLAFTGPCTMDNSRGNPRTLYYRLADLQVRPVTEDAVLVGDGFFERESDGTSFWYWANAPQGKLYLANPSARKALYSVAFDTLVPEESTAATLTVEADGKLVGRYNFPAQPRFSIAVDAGGICCLHLAFDGPVTVDHSGETARTLCYRLADLKLTRTQEDAVLVGDGFFARESDGTSFWYWANASQAQVYLANPHPTSAVYHVQFETAVPPLDGEPQLQIATEQRTVGSYPFPAQPRFSVIVPGESLYPLDLTFTGPATVDTAGAHPRTLYYQLANPKAERSDEIFCFDGSFYPLESDTAGFWRWCSQSTASIWLCPPAQGIYTLRFRIVPFAACAGTVSVRCNGTLLEMQGDTLSAVLPIQHGAPLTLQIETPYTPATVDGRPLCFQVRDFSFALSEEPANR